MYAGVSELLTQFGEDALLVLADRDGDGQIDVPVVERALIDASAEIDGYLAGRYELPLADRPPVLVRVCADIALYRLASDADLGTDERRQRYQDAVKFLQGVSRGQVSLGVSEKVAATAAPSLHILSAPRRRPRGWRGY